MTEGTAGIFAAFFGALFGYYFTRITILIISLLLIGIFLKFTLDSIDDWIQSKSDTIEYIHSRTISAYYRMRISALVKLGLVKSYKNTRENK